MMIYFYIYLGDNEQDYIGIPDYQRMKRFTGSVQRRRKG